MSENKRQRARRLFMELAELSVPERSAALAQACGGDAELRAEVEALFDAERSAGAFLSHPTANEAATQSAGVGSPERERAGARIDRYKLLEQIGEGGMGTIWMAEQREPVKRRVALKIIKLGMDTKQVIARFEAERQALAMMDHPHIAKVLDAGATETGRPYFVMEYIKGVPILEYCDREKLDTRSRLELFTSVCHAIQHAHQKGIIHRDIKPSNVLVTLHDGVPVPKVIDFGIAKATNSELTTKTLFTEHRQMIGTPAYMSPEQAELSGLDIDTRSDIYSLGVLLYELLTGTTPFDTKKLLESGFNEMLRAIREDEPHKPSTRISSLGDTGTRTAQQRRVELEKLSRLLRGDLDWIVMKCLEKDRTRRFETANGLAADIGRHLRDEPVTAGAPSASYKLRKFAKRNRAQVIAASAVLTALLAAIVGTSWGLVQKSRARSAQMLRRLEDEQRSATESARLDRDAQAVTALLDQCEGALRGDDAAKARISMDAARRRTVEGEAVKEAERLSRLAADLELLIELDAIDQFRWAWKDNAFAPMEIVVPRMREALAKFGVDVEVVSVDSAATAVNASTVRERVVAVLDWLLWERRTPQTTLGAHALLRRLDDDPFRNEVRDTFLSRSDPNENRFVELVGRPAAMEQPPAFAAFLGEFNQIDERRRIELLQAAVIRRPRSLVLLMTLGRLCFATADPRDELRWCQAALAAAPANFAAQSNLGVALKIDGRLSEAIASQHRAIELDPMSAGAYLNLANALALSGQVEEALENHKKAIEIQPDHFEHYCCLGNTLGRAGRFDEAVAALEKALELDPKHAEAHYTLGVTLQAQGKLDEAIRAFERGLEFEPKSVEAYLNIGTARRNQGRLLDAVEYFEKCIEINPRSAPAQANLGGVLAQLGRFDEGIRHCEEAIESDPKYALAHYNLGTTYLNRGPVQLAITTLERAVELDPKYADAHCNLARALRTVGRHEEALAAFRRGHELGSQRPDWNYPSADWIRETEAEIAKAARLEPKLSALLEGRYQPTDNAERLELAYLCQDKSRNYAATGLFTAVLAADPKFGENVESSVRYNAACVAALSAAGRGEDAKNLGEEERMRLRGQALDWLRADLNVAAGRLGSSDTSKDPWSRWFCTYSLTNADLVSLREPDSLAKLPEIERAEFTRLWAEMAALAQVEQTPLSRSVPADATPARPPGIKSADPEQLKRLNALASERFARGNFADAEATQRELLGMQQRHYGGDHREVAMGLQNLAVTLRESGRFADAEPFQLQALEMLQRLLPGDNGDVALALHVLGTIREGAGRAGEAVPSYEAALQMNRRSLPVSHPNTLACMTSLARAYYFIGRFEKAVPLFEEALHWQELTLGRQHPETLMTIGNVGANYSVTGRVAEAIPLLEEAWRNARQYPQLRFVDSHLFNAYVQTADPSNESDKARALELLDGMLAEIRGTLAKGSPELAQKLTTVGLSLIDLRAFDAAERLLHEALAIREKEQPDVWTTFNTKSALGGALLGQEKLAEAEPLLLAGYRGMKDREASIPSQGAIRIEQALERLVQLYVAQGAAAEAEKWRRELASAQAESDGAKR